MVEVYYVELVQETDQAYLIETTDGAQVWLPKSQCELDESDMSVQVPEWLAYNEGLI